MSKPNVALGLSGGVDSAVSAYLLKQAGFSVYGIFLKVYENTDSAFDVCPWREDMAAAQEVASFLDIPFESWNFTKEYEQTILRYFFSELKKGRTPNPDVLCNTDIKFGVFLDTALKRQFDYVATGHYVQTVGDNSHHHRLLRGKDTGKDQSYFLSRVPQEKLGRSLFPIGGLTKKQVRTLAQQIKLPNATRPDSQGICFIGSIDVGSFIRAHMKLTPGSIVDEKGIRLGQHDGLELYTIGQRQGIGIGGAKKPYFVIKKNKQTAELVVAQGKDNEKLYCKELVMEDVVWIHKPSSLPLQCLIQIRYRQQPVQAILSSNTNRTTYTVSFADPQRAVTPGQFCAVYRGNECLGSGCIV